MEETVKSESHLLKPEEDNSPSKLSSRGNDSSDSKSEKENSESGPSKPKNESSKSHLLKLKNEKESASSKPEKEQSESKPKNENESNSSKPEKKQSESKPKNEKESNSSKLEKEQSESKPKTEKKLFSSEFRILVRDFVVAYLIEEPEDLFEFAIEYFSRDLLKEIDYTMLVPEYENRRSLDLDFVNSSHTHVLETNVAHNKRFSDVSHQIFEGQGIEKRVGYSDKSYDPDELHNTVEYQKSDFTRDRLIEVVKKTFFMRILDPDVLKEIVDAMRLVTVEKGEYILKEGLNVDTFFVIESGTFKESSSQSPDDYKIIEGDGHFGGLALHYEYPHTSNVITETFATLWILDRRTFRSIILRHATEKRRHFESICNRIVILKELSENKKMDLYDALEQMDLPTRTILFKEGDQSTGMYFIQEGQVKTFNLNAKGEEINVRLYSKGHFFGETAIMEKKPQRFTAMTVGSFRAAFLPVKCFDKVLGATAKQHMHHNVEEYEKQIEDWHGVPSFFPESSRYNKKEYFM